MSDSVPAAPTGMGSRGVGGIVIATVLLVAVLFVGPALAKLSPPATRVPAPGPVSVPPHLGR